MTIDWSLDMETETHTTTLADVTRLQAEVKELLEKYAAGDVEGLEAAQREAVLQHLRSVDGDLDRFLALLEENTEHSDNSVTELIQRLASVVADHAQQAAANMSTPDDAARLGKALLAAGMAPPDPSAGSLEEISGLDTSTEAQPPAPHSAPPPATSGAPAGILDTLRQLTAGSGPTGPRSHRNATPDDQEAAANDMRRRPDQMPDALESRLIGLVSAQEDLVRAQDALLASSTAQAQLSASNDAGRKAIAKILPGSPGWKQYTRRCRRLRKAQDKVVHRADGVAKLQQNRPDLFAQANLDKKQF